MGHLSVRGSRTLSGLPGLRRRRLVLSTLLGAILALGVCASVASAIEGAPPWSYAMAHELMSPFCPGRTLAECPSPQATDLRFWILTQAAAGASEAEVRSMLSARWGDVLLAAPRAEGWGLSAYVIPIAFFVLGGPVVVLMIRRLVRRQPAQATPQPAQASVAGGGFDADLERQLESDLGEI